LHYLYFYEAGKEIITLEENSGQRGVFFLGRSLFVLDRRESIPPFSWGRRKSVSRFPMMEGEDNDKDG